jgi:hypothetical protein
MNHDQAIKIVLYLPCPALAFVSEPVDLELPSAGITLIDGGWLGNTWGSYRIVTS